MLPNVLLLFIAVNYCQGQSINSPPLDWIQTDGTGAYRFGYATGDEGRHYHVSSATADNTVAGRFGYKEPGTGRDLQTTYTAGRRGFRARGPHIARRMDLSQNKPPFSRPNDDGQYHPELDNYFDPNEDRGYDFSYSTPDHVKEEHADRAGDVQGRYSYLDDIGFRHNVQYVAGSKTGFVVTNPVPDTFAQARGGPLYYVGKSGGAKVRGFSAVQKNLNGAYRFLASGPDHKRSEISDASGNRRGVYTYLDDKGVQHTVEYIAGPKIGYKVINNKKGVNYNPILPYFPDSPTVQPLFPASPSPGGGGSKPLGSLPTVPSPPVSPPKNDLFSPASEGGFPTSEPSSGGFPSLGGGSGGFPTSSSGNDGFPSSGSGAGGFPSFSGAGSGGGGGGLSSSQPLFPLSPTRPSRPSANRPSSGSNLASGKPPTLFKPSPSKPTSDIGSSEKGSSFSFDQKEGFPSTSPTFPSTSPFPTQSSSQGPGDFGESDQKWNYDFDYFFNDPTSSNKDWSKPIKGQSGSSVGGTGSSTVIPTLDPFPDFFPSPLPGPSLLLPSSFDEGLNTAESGNGLKPPFDNRNKENCNQTSSNEKGDDGQRNKNDGNYQNRPDGQISGSGSGNKGKNDGGAKHYYKGHKAIHYPSRGTVKFGGVKKNEWHKVRNDDGYFAIPPGVAVRAHVQSLDIVPYDKRFVSPGEALKHHDDKKQSE